jgi:UDP-glucose 4-epimerase
MKKIKVIVTGGCGFIGSHLVDELVKKNYDVHVIDDLSAVSNEKFYFNELATYHKISIVSHELLEDIFIDVEYVFHLAAESRIQTAIENPRYAYTVNVIGTLNILELCKKHKIKRLLLSSTSSIYGLTENLPTSENEKTDCLNAYSQSKYFSEQLCHLYKNLFDIVIFRYFNVFGERSPVKGLYAPVIGIFLDQFSNEQPLTIVGDGEQRRDFIHVSDIVKCNINSIESKTNFNCEVYNVGSGLNHSINQIAWMISENFIYIPNRSGEARNTLSDISKIKEKINFTPTINIVDFLNTQIKK